MGEERIRRPRDDEEAPAEQEMTQEELNRRSRATGGDAPAAGSIEEREALARDDPEPWEEEGEEDEGA